MNKLKRPAFWISFFVTLICAVAGSFLAQFPYLSLVGALVLSMILGIGLQLNTSLLYKANAESGFISNKFLRLGIILLGFKLNLIQLAQAGIKSILLAICIVTGMIFFTYWVSRKMGVERDLAILTATGSGICGAAAVMGISPQIKVTKEKEAQQRENEVLAVATVAILGTVFTLVEIILKPLFHMSAVQFGVFTGGSLHEIAHAVAAGSAAGPVGLDNAIITKLSRVLLLAPVALIVGIWHQAVAPAAHGTSRAKLPIPWFMVGFLITSLIGSFLPIPASVLALLVKIAYIVLGMAMAALGMNVNFDTIIHRGRNAFTAAFICSCVLMLAVLAASKLFF
nr:putative sulfate exporter family transporter [Liquorilactobacillus capillatus]